MTADHTPDDGGGAARRAWTHLEPLHDIVYFAPDLRARTDAAGLRGFWMAYFAMRSAPLGAASPELVTATFYGFDPALVHRALPDAWNRIDPAGALALREHVVDAGLREVLGDEVVESPEVTEAADLAWAAAQKCETAGRPLAAANQAVPRPSAPHLALWQATSVLREHRGDGHIAVLIGRGVSPMQAHLIKIGAGESDDGMLRAARGFADDDWTQARERLQSDGIIDAEGALTERGAAEHARIERATDTAAAQPWRQLGAARTERMLALVCPLAKAMAKALPVLTPVGLTFDPSCRHDTVGTVDTVSLADSRPAATPG
jgi:hypothetical protein